MRKNSLVEVFTKLNKQAIPYLIVGGYAVIAHGLTRFTQDLDLVLDLENTKSVERAIQAFAELGFQPRAPVPFTDFADPSKRQEWAQNKDMAVFPIWRSVSHGQDEIDLFLDVPFDGFRAAYQAALWLNLPGDISMSFVDRARLIAMKKTAARHQDLADIEQLEQLRHGAQHD